jgi:alkylation response protein AidB-like acyl-CoA dehydrogenase
MPGALAGYLDRRVGDFAGPDALRRSAGPGSSLDVNDVLIELARGNGKIADPLVRQDLAQLHTLDEIGRYTTLRQRALRASGNDIPGIGNLAKLSMSRTLRLQRDLGLRILGPLGMLHAYSAQGQEDLVNLTGNRLAPVVTEMALFSPAPSIYGGSDEIQRNIVGERVLGLPKEPNNDRTLAFRDLPKNA